VRWQPYSISANDGDKTYRHVLVQHGVDRAARRRVRVEDGLGSEEPGLLSSVPMEFDCVCSSSSGNSAVGQKRAEGFENSGTAGAVVI
jgi:hypothetical protein